MYYLLIDGCRSSLESGGARVKGLPSGAVALAGLLSKVLSLLVVPYAGVSDLQSKE